MYASNVFQSLRLSTSTCSVHICSAYIGVEYA
jgi:hypothetical protein